MAAASGVDVEIVWDDLPLLPGVLAVPGRGNPSRRGRAEPRIVRPTALIGRRGRRSRPMLDLCFDPQTSGGLLIAVPESVAGRLARPAPRRRNARGGDHRPGDRQGAGTGRVACRRTADDVSHCARRSGSRRRCASRPIENHAKSVEEIKTMSCCSNPSESAAASDASAGEATRRDSDGEAAAEVPRFSASGQRARRARTARRSGPIAIALSVLAQCEPCVKIHMKKAREMGFTAGRDRRGRLDGHRLRRLADDDVL